jgi:hypothetical protein
MRRLDLREIVNDAMGIDGDGDGSLTIRRCVWPGRALVKGR